MLRSQVTGAKGQDDFSFRVVGARKDFLGLPGYFVVFKRVSRGNAFAVHDEEVLIEMDANIDFIEAMLPLFIDLVFKGEFDVGAADLPAVDEEERHFVRGEGLLADDVVQQRLALIVRLSAKPGLKGSYLSSVTMSTTDPVELGEIRLFMSLLLFQSCSPLVSLRQAVSWLVPSTANCPNCSTSFILAFCKDS